MTDDEIERFAQRAHREFNSGVDADASPLTWKTENDVIKEWWRRIAMAALESIEDE